MTTSHWICIKCRTRGEYVEPATKTDTSPAAKHLKTCRAATVTCTRAELLDRIATRPGAWA